MGKTLDVQLKCYHCGSECRDGDIAAGGKIFCCQGCRTVYEILEINDLSRYYALSASPGTSQKKISTKEKFEYLDHAEASAKLLDLTDGIVSVITLFIPQMHCSSCIWLLENLYKFNAGIQYSRVNFLQKKITIRFNESIISLKNVVELLTAIGYEPEINLSSTEKESEEDERNKKSRDKSIYYKTGVAGFCFGNIMLLSFPEYLSIVNNVDLFLKSIFSYLILLLSLPVFFYCSSDYFSSAVRALQKKMINIDFPISLGILALFGRSIYEILSSSGTGYMDSLSGLVFFLLLGRMFQDKTYDILNFERNYKSYFPAYAVIKNEEREQSIPLSALKVGDRIIIRNDELIPADSVLICGRANIDYSFVSGESAAVEIPEGSIIHAGGRQRGTALELEVIKKTSQSYITQLWNNSDFTKPDENKIAAFSILAGKYFTLAVLLTAGISGICWLNTGIAQALNVFTSVLIVACPCALALSAPFTLGSTLRIFGRSRFYLKNASVVEKLSGINHVVFDKTGTLTSLNERSIRFYGSDLSQEDNEAIKSVLHNSIHPLSRSILKLYPEVRLVETENFREYPGRGLEGKVQGRKIRLGSVSFVIGTEAGGVPSGNSSSVYVSIDDDIKGFFRAGNIYREGLKDLAGCLQNYEVSVLSGDYDGEKETLRDILGTKAKMFFRQSPYDKLSHIKKLQNQNKRTLMIGDGLNDAGALMKSDVGISISEEAVNFSPACDAILEAQEFGKLGEFLKFSKISMKIIYMNLAVSLLYNIAGVGFAVNNSLTPVISAILMPLSSITVVLLATAATNLAAKIKGLK
ncbi:MAG TPA: heavy metal translocating P-type ATPase metal-binding domain-containing protein [Ignavibacteriales bacterium]|nr:heavy metal translocating P-type ATPase metal-binding domain-containing protein [Ignavibacteriales bacterium]